MTKELYKNALENGLKVNRYEIREVLGINSFWIIYKAWDAQFKCFVVIKEYFPMSIAVRADDSIKVTADEEHLLEYQDGLQKFVNDTHTMLPLLHQNIVIIRDFIQENNIVYRIMKYGLGQNMADKSKQHGLLKEAELKDSLKPLLKVLKYLPHPRHHFC